MGKQLFLIRHAEAEEPGGQKDFDRELTHLGLIKASRGGQLLADLGTKPGAFYASSAKRAAYTAELIHERLGQDLAPIQFVDNLYNASPRILLELIGKLNNNLASVVLVGHNPSITYVAEYLTGESLANGMAPGGIALLVSELAEWSLLSQRTCQLAWYREPEAH